MSERDPHGYYYEKQDAEEQDQDPSWSSTPRS